MYWAPQRQSSQKQVICVDVLWLLSMKRCILDTERTTKATHPFRSTGKLVRNHERHSIHCWKGQNEQTVTFPADFRHATSHISSDRSSIHGIDTWLIARRSYCQPFARSNLPVVSLCLRHSCVSPYQIRNPVNPPCSIHTQFHGLNFESFNLVQLPKQTVFETENKHKHFKRTHSYLLLPHRTIWMNSVMSEQEDKEHAQFRCLVPLQAVSTTNT